MVLESLILSVFSGLGTGLARKYAIEPLIGEKRLNAEVLKICERSFNAVRDEFGDCFERDEAPVDWNDLPRKNPALKEFVNILTHGDVHSEPDWNELYDLYKKEFLEAKTHIEQKRFGQLLQAIWAQFWAIAKDHPLFQNYYLARVLRSLDSGVTAEKACHLMREYCRIRAVKCREEIFNRYAPLEKSWPEKFDKNDITEEFCQYIQTAMSEEEDRWSVDARPRDEKIKFFRDREVLLKKEACVIIGDGGVGKTRLLQEYEKELCGKFAKETYPEFIPMYFMASDLAHMYNSKQFVELIRDRLVDTFGPLTGSDPGTKLAGLAQRLHNEAKLYLLIDAFDQAPNKSEKVIAKLLIQPSLLGRCKKIVSTRPYDLEKFKEGIKSQGGQPDVYEVVRLHPFSKTELEEFFGRFQEMIEQKGIISRLDTRDEAKKRNTDPENLLCIPLLALLIKRMALEGHIAYIRNRSDIMRSFIYHIVRVQADKDTINEDGTIRDAEPRYLEMIERIEELALNTLCDGWLQDFPKEYVFDQRKRPGIMGKSWRRDWELAGRIEFIQALFDYEGTGSLRAPTHRFQHLLLQEYLAAMALWNLYRSDCDSNGSRPEMLELLKKLAYNSDNMSRFLAELIATGDEGDLLEDCKYWHELLIALDTDDWVRTYALEIRDKIASENEKAMEFLEGEFAREKVAVPEDAMEVLIPAGPFIMGSYDYSDERPVRLAKNVEEFVMDRYPVTNEQFLEFMTACFHGVSEPKDGEGNRIINFSSSKIRGENGVFRVLEGFDRHPVAGVTWYGAKAYCLWKSEVEGRSVVLPTEEMWEKAARAGLGRAYPWGNIWDAVRCNTYEGGKGSTTKVGMYLSGESLYGCHDMAGNVLEWTDSWYYGDKDIKVLRGGSWNDFRSFARCAYRFWFGPEYWFDTIGFRCARIKK